MTEQEGLNEGLGRICGTYLNFLMSDTSLEQKGGTSIEFFKKIVRIDNYRESAQILFAIHQALMFFMGEMAADTVRQIEGLTGFSISDRIIKELTPFEEVLYILDEGGVAFWLERGAKVGTKDVLARAQNRSQETPAEFVRSFEANLKFVEDYARKADQA